MLRRILHLLLAAALAAGLAPRPAAAGKRALFDNFHAEQAGNADWVIDDNQPTPVPAQSAIVPSTPRTYWQGGISSWGVDLVKRGFTVTTNTAAFTYGNAANPLDLQNFDVLIVPEPNTLFSAGESAAMLAFVHDGGGLVAVSDHDGSDRNSDGFDSPKIWNAFDPAHLLGVHWGSTGDANNNIVQTSTNVNPAPSDSVTHGPEGAVIELEFHNGTTLTLLPADNPSVRGEVWMIGLPQSSTTGLMAASARYGSGRVFFAGDSSPIDDGSANPGNTSIFDGWGEGGGADSVLFMNATMWASRRDPTLGVPGGANPGLALSRPVPNPAHATALLQFSLPAAGVARLEILDLTGRRVWSRREALGPGPHAWTWNGRDASGRAVAAGLYGVRLQTPWGTRATRLAWIR
jgi:hypothetical protein